MLLAPPPYRLLPPSSASHPPQGARAWPQAVEQARLLTAIADRRRSAFDHADPFGHPGWDMLMFLVVMEDEGRPVSVTDVIAGAGLSIATGVRWVKHLVDMGFVKRTHDPKDRRRSFVELTNAGRQMLAFTLNG